MNKYSFLLLFFITLLSFIFRFYSLSDRPASLARDEVSAAYNAYALLQTGRDEYGTFLPLAFKAFGDWKLPVEIYLEIPGILLFGLNEFSTRLPEALLGSMSIPLFYFLLKRMLGEKNTPLALLASLMLAISPWHTYMSRVAIGYNVLGLFFFIAAVYFFYGFIKGSRKQLLFANICFILTLFSYTAFHIFTPLFIFFLFLLYRKSFTKSSYIYLQLVLFLLFYAIASISVLEANVQKIAGTSLWHDPNFYLTEVFDKRQIHEQSQMSKIIHNKPFAFLTKLSTNYINSFSPEFLVIKGGENKINNLEGFGNMYIFEYVLFLIGIGFALTKKIAHKSVFFMWLLIAAVPAIITKEAPQSTRDLMMVPMLSFFASFGLLEIYHYVASLSSYKKLLGQIMLTALLLFGVVNVVSFVDNYLNHMPSDRGEYWSAGYREVVRYVQKSNPRKIVMGDMSRSPYNYFLFYLQYDPEKYVREVKRANPTWDNFVHVASFNKYYFVENIDFIKDIKDRDTLYIDRLEKFPPDYPVEKILSDDTGIYRFGVIDTGNTSFCQKQFPSNLRPALCEN